MEPKNCFKVQCLDRWAYLAGLIEADGHVKYLQQSIIAIIITGHKGQAFHFYWLANAVGMPFSLSMPKAGNTLRLVWTNPRSIEYIMRRLSSFILYHNGVLGATKLFTKLDFVSFKKLKSSSISSTAYKNYLQKINSYHNKVAINKKKNLLNPNNLLIISILVGFIDGDGETQIQIGATHRNSSSKNIISGFIRISQKNLETLNAIVHLFTMLDADVFNHVTTLKTTSGGHCLSLTERQSAHFAKLANPKSFQNPWTSLGTELIIIIHLFKRHFNFSALGRYVKNRALDIDSLVYWAKQRMYLIIVLQLIRLFVRDANSIGVARLKERLDQAAGFLEQGLQPNKTPVINFKTNAQLLNKLEKCCLNSRFLYPLIKEVVQKNSLSIQDPGPLQPIIQQYIIRALGLYKQIYLFKSMVLEQIENQKDLTKSKEINLTYYPSLSQAKESLRFKPNVELIKVFLEKTRKKRAWYKTRQFLL